MGWAGIASQISRIDLGKGEVDWFAYYVLSHGFQPGVRSLSREKSEKALHTTGVGCHPDSQEALICAIAECVERTSAAFWSEDRVIVSSADALADKALDLNSLPVCDEEEYRSPYCLLERPRKSATIRWIEGQLLGEDRKAWIPLVLSHLYTDRRLPGEQIAHSISTGLAAHSSFEAAGLRSVLETIERDALALTWLLRRQVPRVLLRDLDSVTQAYLDQHERLSPHVTLEVFDITTDLGIPVLLCLQSLHARPFAHSLVSCSCAPTYREALQKVLRDAVLCRSANSTQKPYPARLEEFHDLASGAAYMADAARKDAFQFLRSSPLTVRWIELEEINSRKPLLSLQSLVSGLKRKNIEVYLADLSTVESLDLGLYVTRAVIPALQPISFHYAARYLGHERLTRYRAASSAAGFYHEGTINPFPLPFD